MTDSSFEIPKSRTDPSCKRIEKRVWIKASAAVVYRALTASKELAKWFCDRADCNPCPGGEFIAVWKTGKAEQKGRALVTRAIPDISLELLWMEDGRDTGPGSPRHTLSYTIKSKSGMTEVLMVDDDDDVTDEETYTILDRGWNTVLLELKDFCERKERSARLRSNSKARIPEEVSEQSTGPDDL
ncbi:MAG: SRPBCC domain-containing protein [Acidobacteria bacterium]|nr:SRPBCC domain-containing protein [Acidobacteriota bacterium]